MSPTGMPTFSPSCLEEDEDEEDEESELVLLLSGLALSRM